MYIETGTLPWDMDLPTDARIRQKVAEAAISVQEKSDSSESSSDSHEEEEEEEEAGDGDGDSDSEGDESESSEGEEMDIVASKKRFMENLRKLHQKRGTPIIRHPVLGQKDVDLYLLHQYVTDYGGMEKVRTYVGIVHVCGVHTYVSLSSSSLCAWHQVTQDLKWRSIYLRLGLPPSQTNCSSAIKQAYRRYCSTGYVARPLSVCSVQACAVLLLMSQEQPATKVMGAVNKDFQVETSCY